MKANKKKKFISGKRLAIILYVVLGLLILFFLIQSRIIENPINSINKKVEQRNVTDICTVLGGRLIHSIKNEESCGNICEAECESIEGVLDKSEFIAGVNSCNQCSCYCRR